MRGERREREQERGGGGRGSVVELVAKGIPRVCVKVVEVVKMTEVGERKEERRGAIVIWIQADKGYALLVPGGIWIWNRIWI